MELIFNYIKVAIRSLFKKRSDAVLNVIGLSIGITISILVFMYVRYELAYDKAYTQNNRTYRVITKGNIGGNEFENAMTPQPLSAFLRNNFPEIESVVKIVRGANKLVTYNEKKFNEDNFFYADSSFFSVFDIPIIKGDSHHLLKNDEDLVITAPIAEKYFGNENPIGKLLKLDNGLHFYVSGVCKPQPENSHFHFDFIASQQSVRKLFKGKKEYAEPEKPDWLRIDWYTYFVLRNKKDATLLEERIQKELHNKVQNQIAGHIENKDSAINEIKSLSFHLQPVESIHLHSNLDDELEPNSKYIYVALFLTLAIFVLLITCINFMNLTTARASIRIKEIGVRKLVGVNRKSLMMQFVVEAITYSFVALFIGLVLVELLLPVFNSLFDLNLGLNRIEGRFDLLYIILLTFLVGIFSGIYPAISFSRLNEISIFKEGFQPQKKGVIVRGVLAAMQMTVTTFLIILCLSMLWQIQYLRNKDLGFNSDNIIVVERGYSIGKELDQFKRVLKSIPNIQEVSACSILPGEKASLNSINYPSKSGDKLVLLPLNFVEKDFFKTLDLKLEAGAIWDDKKNEHIPDLVINKQAQDFLKMNKPLGQRMTIMGKHSKESSIKGVVKNFHFEPVQFPIRPLILQNIHQDSFYDNLLIKVGPKGDLNHIIKQVNAQWNKFTDNDPFEYKMLNETLSDNLNEESLVLKISLIIMLLSMLVAWLGLRAFAAYIGEMKEKEFRSKKIIGASSNQILSELFMSISHYVLPGILLSIPISFFVISLWLNGFAYYSRLPLLFMFVISVIVWGICFLLVLIHSGKSVKSSPVDI
ncbi:ABC transporter permease [Saccharicrinis sp. 156]|uniref:ABC transporter permease n=1 Tax=Saccharicrinis sp. 156 TaxID=3417574 RepID=UPI003D327356